jgi:hypothetical protein
MTHHYEQLKDEHMVAQHRKFSPVDSLGISFRRFGKRELIPQNQNSASEGAQ